MYIYIYYMCVHIYMCVYIYIYIHLRIILHRYLSHYRSIHRGQFFTTMKSTAVRKLLPESWGFVCPV